MRIDLPGIYRTYEELLSDVDREFDRVRDTFIDRMQCRMGCSSCCTQLFPISAIEAAYISKAVKALDPEAREQMRLKALAYLEELTGSDVDENQSIEAHSRVVQEALDRLVGAPPHPLSCLGGRHLLHLRPPPHHSPQVRHSPVEPPQARRASGVRAELQRRRGHRSRRPGGTPDKAGAPVVGVQRPHPQPTSTCPS